MLSKILAKPKIASLYRRNTLPIRGTLQRCFSTEIVEAAQEEEAV